MSGSWLCDFINQSEAEFYTAWNASPFCLTKVSPGGSYEALALDVALRS